MRAVRSPLMVPLLVTAVLAGLMVAVAPAASAATCGGAALDGQLYGVAATSASNAWAVGNYRGKAAARTLIEHWNGTQWCRVPSPDPASPDQPNGLQAVTATSATNAWAVGHYFTDGAGYQTLILHWNGTAWAQVPSPNPGGSSGFNELSGVAATSASNAWAVGQYATTTAGRLTLILHWNGTAWTQVVSPTPSAPPTLFGVAASSAKNVWAAGEFSDPSETLTMRWNGTAWKRVKSPNPQTGTGHSSELSGVATTSAANAWAVGSDDDLGQIQNLVLHWNGTAWKPVDVPEPGTDPGLSAVAATSASNAWAVGDIMNGTVSDTLVLHWNGTSWTQPASPSPGGPAAYDLLNAVAATSATDAWAVGSYSNGPTGSTLILHWDGTTWTQIPSP